MSSLRSIHVVVAAALALSAGACATRSAAATQSTIKAFDAAKSDPKAVAIADQVLEAVGGKANWDKAKEIVWTQGTVIDGKLQDVVKHAWDRWEGRHQFTRWFGDGGHSVAMYELFGDVTFGYSTSPEGQTAKQMQADKEKSVAEAKRRYAIDSYLLFLPFKLKDPGVKLAYAQESADLDAKTADAPMKFDMIKITFEDGVGPAPGDTWYLSVDKATHMPAWIEHVAAGKPDTERGGMKLEEWVESGGLKLATRRVTLGYGQLDSPKVAVQVPPVWAGKVPIDAVQVPSKAEVVLIQNIAVNATVNEDLYVPDVKVFGN